MKRQMTGYPYICYRVTFGFLRSKMPQLLSPSCALNTTGGTHAPLAACAGHLTMLNSPFPGFFPSLPFSPESTSVAANLPVPAVLSPPPGTCPGICARFFSDQAWLFGKCWFNRSTSRHREASGFFASRLCLTSNNGSPCT